MNEKYAIELLESRTLLAVTPNDPLFPQQWALPKTSAPQAWEITTGSSKVVVNVNDTGIDYTHPDLYLNIWLNQKEIPFAIGSTGNTLRDTDADGLITFWDLNARNNGRLVNEKIVTDLNGTGYIDAGDLLSDPRWEDGTDQGGNGFVDDLVGWDFADNDNDPMDEFFHGTACAGVIGAVGNNGEGVAGVAWRVQLMATKGTALDVGTVELYMEGMRYAADNGARITNNSWIAFKPTKELLNQLYNDVNYLRSKDVFFVAAAGNDGRDIDPPGKRIYPAAFDLPNIVSVAASNQADQLSSFSNYGLTTVDLAAPGEDLNGTIPLWLNPAMPYGAGSGTSFAAPQVAGAAALLLARNPNLSYAQLKDLILSNVDPLPAFAGKTVSGGRLNIYRAIAAVPAPAAAPATSASSLFSTTPLSSGRDLLAALDALLA